ncbi:MAG: N-acetylmuramoyl-L-alanine amidase [Eubacterium sp.]|nr:N-acetylmuramoyl-L-alanine amidase [Eubacterium sp.]
MIYIKRTYCILAAVLFTVAAALGLHAFVRAEKPVSARQVSSRYTVVIDAGHGGRDAGTVGIDGTPEKDINLAIAKDLYDFLNVCGIHAVLIRDGDYEYYPPDSDRSRSDLYNRLDFVNSIPSSVLISIHQNHFEQEKEWGTQIWYSANTAESKQLADSILSQTKLFLQPDNERENKASDDSYYILYRASVPSVMIECGFMSNRAENERLQQPSYQQAFAYVILLGICEEV